MALPPCHMTYQYQVAGGRLSGMLWQRSCDLGLGFAFNAFSAAMLLRMLAQQFDLEPGELVWSAGDAHVYLNHENLVHEQLARAPPGRTSDERRVGKGVINPGKQRGYTAI